MRLVSVRLVNKKPMVLHTDCEKDIRRKTVLKKGVFANSDRKQKQLFVNTAINVIQMSQQLFFLSNFASPGVSFPAQKVATKLRRVQLTSH